MQTLVYIAIGLFGLDVVGATIFIALIKWSSAPEPDWARDS